MAKPKNIPRTKEQLLADLRANKEWQEKMAFVRDIFYPALCKATVSIDDALQNLGIINSVILEKFLAKMKEVKMKDIDIRSNLSDKDPMYENLKAMLALFDDKSVFEAKELFEGMKSEIGQFVIDEQRNRPLDILPTKWMSDL